MDQAGEVVVVGGVRVAAGAAVTGVVVDVVASAALGAGWAHTAAACRVPRVKPRGQFWRRAWRRTAHDAEKRRLARALVFINKLIKTLRTRMRGVQNKGIVVILKARRSKLLGANVVRHDTL